MRSIYIPSGETINQAIYLAISKAKKTKGKVYFEFNGYKYICGPFSDPESVYENFEANTGMFESYFGRPYKRPRK